jgi:hypothetical protein
VCSSDLNPLSVQPLRANVKVFLQGPYHAGSSVMDHTVNTSGVLAAHFGAIPIPTNAVDSITIEIRNAVTAAGSTVRVFQPAWLLKDGSIVGFADTTQGYTTHTAAGGSYYIVVLHRNHLAIMTAAAHALGISTPAAYDFTTAQTQAYSTDYVLSPPTVQVEAGVYGMFGGDANGTGLVSAADANIIFGDLNSPGYDDNDTNLTGIVTAADANLAFGNLNAATGVVRPVAGQRQPLPVVKGRK